MIDIAYRIILVLLSHKAVLVTQSSGPVPVVARLERNMAAESEDRFAAYVEALSAALGHADRSGPFKDYCLGLLMPVERKSVEPLAAITAPGRTAAQHQSLLHVVGQGNWSDERVMSAIRDQVLPSIERHGAIEAWIIDDTGIPKKGKHSVGVTRQYCGQLGKQDNCQVAVSLSIANHAASLPIAYRLYLPEDWALDPDRRSKAGVPDDITFRTKPEIALHQIRTALAAGIPRGIVLMDAGYGADTKLRTAITELGLTYAAGVQPNTSVWRPGEGPLPPKPWSGRGRPTSQRRRDAEHHPVKVKELALALPTCSVGDGHLARGLGRPAHIPVRAAPGPGRPSRREAEGKPAGRVASSSNGPRTRGSRRSTGSARCRRPSASRTSSTPRNFDGASSVTIRT